jgi:hypothetical protein
VADEVVGTFQHARMCLSCKPEEHALPETRTRGRAPCRSSCLPHLKLHQPLSSINQGQLCS